MARVREHILAIASRHRSKMPQCWQMHRPNSCWSTNNWQLRSLMSLTIEWVSISAFEGSTKKRDGCNVDQRRWQCEWSCEKSIPPWLCLACRWGCHIACQGRGKRSGVQVWWNHKEADSAGASACQVSHPVSMVSHPGWYPSWDALWTPSVLQSSLD